VQTICENSCSRPPPVHRHDEHPARTTRLTAGSLLVLADVLILRTTFIHTGLITRVRWQECAHKIAPAAPFHGNHDAVHLIWPTNGRNNRRGISLRLVT